MENEKIVFFYLKIKYENSLTQNVHCNNLELRSFGFLIQFFLFFFSYFVVLTALYLYHRRKVHLNTTAILFKDCE